MKVLLIVGDVVEAASIKKKIEEIIEDDGMGINYDERDTFVAQTKQGEKNGRMVYLLANQKDLYTGNLNDLKKELISQSFLSNTQVVIAASFPN